MPPEVYIGVLILIVVILFYLYNKNKSVKEIIDDKVKEVVANANTASGQINQQAAAASNSVVNIVNEEKAKTDAAIAAAAAAAKLAEEEAKKAKTEAEAKKALEEKLAAETAILLAEEAERKLAEEAEVELARIEQLRIQELNIIRAQYNDKKEQMFKDIYSVTNDTDARKLFSDNPIIKVEIYRNSNNITRIVFIQLNGYRIDSNKNGNLPDDTMTEIDAPHGITSIVLFHKNGKTVYVWLQFEDNDISQIGVLNYSTYSIYTTPSQSVFAEIEFKNNSDQFELMPGKYCFIGNHPVSDYYFIKDRSQSQYKFKKFDNYSIHQLADECDLIDECYGFNTEGDLFKAIKPYNDLTYQDDVDIYGKINNLSYIDSEGSRFKLKNPLSSFFNPAQYVAPTSPYTYIGCYADSSPRVLTGGGMRWYQTTPADIYQRCYDLAKADGAKYFARQDINSCHWSKDGDVYDRLGAVDESRCSGNVAGWTNQTFKINYDYAAN